MSSAQANKKRKEKDLFYLLSLSSTAPLPLLIIQKPLMNHTGETLVIKIKLSLLKIHHNQRNPNNFSK